MGVLKPQSSGQPDKAANSIIARAAEVAAFILFLFAALVTLVIVAVAAPLALAISAIAGLFAGNSDRNGWRPASA